MTTPPRALILRAPGTNCDRETAHAFELAGGKSELVHINRLLEEPTLPRDYQILCLPGGFSYGDDIAAGRILAGQIRHHLAEQIAAFRDAGKLVLGICNGFQILIKSGILLPDGADQSPAATLTWNDSGRFEDRWVRLAVDGTRCIFLRGIESLDLPIAHAEGKFVPRDKETMQTLCRNKQLVLRYCPRDSDDYSTPAPYPQNPNGSVLNTAGVCDETGRVFGLMPHPERFVDATQHPQWTRRGDAGPGRGLQVFVNAVEYFI